MLAATRNNKIRQSGKAIQVPTPRRFTDDEKDLEYDKGVFLRAEFKRAFSFSWRFGEVIGNTMSTQNRTSPRILALRRRGTQTISNPSTVTTRTRLRAATATSPTRRSLDSSTTSASLRGVGTRTSQASRRPASARPTTTASVRPTATVSALATATVSARTTATVSARATATALARTASAPVARTSSTGIRASTRRTISTSNAMVVEEKPLLPIIEEEFLSPFLNTTNLNSRRLSMTLYVFYCPICMMNVKRENRRIMATSCGHVFCDACLVEAHSKRKVCPMCQQNTNSNDFRELFI